MKCFILRGLPGSGKSSLAIMLEHYLSDNCLTFSADRYFENYMGEYNFDSSKIGKAHADCLERFTACVLKGEDHVIVDNTNTQEWEYEKYVKLARQQGYDVIILRVETDLNDAELAKRNIHGVPEETIARMRHRLR